MTDKEKMHSGKLYIPKMTDSHDGQLTMLDSVFEYNQIKPSDLKAQQAKLKEMFCEIGESCFIQTPFYAVFGGKHVHFGNHIYANFGLTLIDDTHIYVGDYTQFGPNVIVCTATHPIDAKLRKDGYQYNKPIHIGKNCWIGAGSIILPGVTIGDNVVIGAGSLVTKDIPDNTLAYGSPCKVVREAYDKEETKETW